MVKKPRLDYNASRERNKWRCTGPNAAFPWGYGNTPEEAFLAWKKLQKRPPPPTMDEHASNPGAAT